MLQPRRIGTLLLALALSCSLIGCAGIAPPKVEVHTRLIPISEKLGADYSLEDDGTVIYERPGMKVAVAYLTDEELNAAFPEHSRNGQASTNPYTYGNWIDPELGYTPNRFTVFKVTVHNYTLPKINLTPSEALLISNRGHHLNSYVREAKETGHLNFEEYYLARKGGSGVEENRYLERMGLIRQTLYIDGIVFKGDMKEGFLVFDPLDSNIKQAELVLKDFVLAYDASGWPSKLVDLTFPFDLKIERETGKE